MRPRISIRGSVGPSVRPVVRLSVRLSVRPSVRLTVPPSVRYACANIAFFGCFWPRWDPTLKQMINLHVLRVFSPVCSSICLSIHMSHDQYTLRHSPDASLPGRACFFSFWPGGENCVRSYRFFSLRKTEAWIFSPLHSAPKSIFILKPKHKEKLKNVVMFNESR